MYQINLFFLLPLLPELEVDITKEAWRLNLCQEQPEVEVANKVTPRQWSQLRFRRKSVGAVFVCCFTGFFSGLTSYYFVGNKFD